MIKLYRVSSKQNESDTWSDEPRFFTTDKNYYENSRTEYDAKDAQEWLFDDKKAKIFNPIKELNLEVNTWSSIIGETDKLNEYGIWYEYFDDSEDEMYAITDTDALADAGNQLGYDATIFPNIPSDYGYGQPFTEYAINNSKYLKRTNQY